MSPRCKRLKRKRRMQDCDGEASTFVHRHGVQTGPDRSLLTHDEYFEMLATPKGYQWAGVGTLNVCPKRRKHEPKRRKISKDVEPGDVSDEFTKDTWEIMTPCIAQRLKDFLVNEFNMPDREADDFIYRKHVGAKWSSSVMMERKPTPDFGLRTKWVKECSDIFLTRIEQYIVSLLMAHRTPDVSRVAERILEQLCNLTGEKTTLHNPKTKLQKILVLIADRVALWALDVTKDTICRRIEREPDKPTIIDKPLEPEEVLEPDETPEEPMEPKPEETITPEKEPDKKPVEHTEPEKKPEDTIEPDETIETPMEPTTEPEETDEKPEDTREDSETPPQPTDPSGKPDMETEGTTEPAEQPEEPDKKPEETTQPTEQPGGPDKKPEETTEPTEQPEGPDKKPEETTEPTEQPGGPDKKPEETTQPTEQPEEPDKKPEETTEPTEQPGGPDKKPEETIQPAEQPEGPSEEPEEITEPTEQPEGPDKKPEETTEPAEQPEGPDEESEETTEPTEPPEEPDKKPEETTEPTEQPGEPSKEPEETTEPAKVPEESGKEPEEITEKPEGSDEMAVEPIEKPSDVSEPEKTVEESKEPEVPIKESEEMPMKPYEESEKPIVSVEKPVEIPSDQAREPVKPIYKPIDILEIIVEDISDTRRVEGTDSHKEIKDAVERRIDQLIGKDIDRIPPEDIDDAASRVAHWVEEIMTSKKPKAVYCTPVPAFGVNISTGSALEVQKVSCDTVRETTAFVRGVETSHKPRKVPSSVSPINLKSTQEWIDWATNVASIADEWGDWLDSTLTDAEKQITNKKKDEFQSREKWKQWRDNAQYEILKWRSEQNKINDEGMIWAKKLETPKQDSEKEVKSTDFS